ncbi:MAG TPA: formate/nitrite transporter family protein [Pseudolabrys sp.]|nr:formate/nitrite transporter family protein [Pseudolabrys sp.]
MARPASKKTQEKSARHQSGSKRTAVGMTADEIKNVEELSSPRTPVIYEVVRRLGEEELERPVTSLWWSGLAAGLSMSFSLLAQAVLLAHLPESSWRLLLAGFGYSLGFLMAVLGRQQLFTESTITVVLPVLKDLSFANLYRLVRLWAIVFAANIAGTLFAALFCSFTPVLPDELYRAMLEISRILLTYSWRFMLFGGISSGFLIAAMVWMIPSAESAKVSIVVIMTWLIAVGGFTHIIAGSMEAFLLVIAGEWEWWRMLIDFMIPVLIGNMIGGTALFALLSYAQVMEEI